MYVGASCLLSDDVAVQATQRLVDCSADMQRVAGAQLAGTRMMIVGDEDACRYDVLTNGTLCIPANFKVEASVCAYAPHTMQ